MSQTPLLEGWCEMRDGQAVLIGSRCAACGSYYFPRQAGFCRNPDCESETFEDLPLSRSGTLWSYTDARYQPPAPYVAAEPYQPYAIAAVELEAEQMIILGQVVSGVPASELEVGMSMDLALEGLDDGRLVWKWKPA